jgi:Ca-activated chloride channel family protein
MADYTLQQLVDEAGVTPRTIRYYIAQGLLASPGAGSGARYTDAHLERLRLIRQLQRNHLPLAEIRKQLAGQAAVDYIRSVMPPPAPMAAMALSSAPSPRQSSAPARLVGPPVRQPEPTQEPDRSQWD